MSNDEMEQGASPELAPPGTPATFVADNLGLDFLNSIASPVDVPVEWLGNGEAFVEWLRQAELVPADVLEAMIEKTVPGELDAVAGQARALREWFRKFVHKHRGKPLPRTALKELEPINRILIRDARHAEIVPAKKTPESASPFMLLEKRNWTSSEALLIPIAEAMARLVAEEDFTHVKGCEGHACTLLFVDRTRRRARRWCSMAVCGNRAKVAAFRKREHS
jgi:predicted RNA-binding Zn ribbon-like protein